MREPRCFIVMMLSCLVAGTTAWPAAGAGLATTVSTTLSNGEVRESLLYIPEGASATAEAPLPVVLGFHGGGGSPASFRALTGLDATADANGFAVLYADAGDGLWGDWRDVTGDPADDLEYVALTLETLGAEHRIDLDRVYATGLSNGGAFSLVLASELRTRIAAVAPVAHNMTQAFAGNASPGGGVDVLQIIGTADPITPFEGGPITAPGGGAAGESLGSDATIAFWKNVIGAGEATETLLPNSAVDGTFAGREVYEPGPDGTELERIIVYGGGHTWPGGLQYLPEPIIGATSRDFHANDAIWNFFEGQVVVPVPSSLIVLVSGIAALSQRRRRRWDDCGTNPGECT